jgi:outer membrane protein assembly factor BamB
LAGFPHFEGDSNFSTPAEGNLYNTGWNDIVQGGASTAGNAFGILYHNGGHLRVQNVFGTLQCQYNTDQEIDSSPAIGHFLANAGVGIVVGTGSYWPNASTTGDLFAFNTHCQPIWKDKLDGLTNSSPSIVQALGNGQLQIAEGTDIGPTHKGTVWLLNGATGHSIWHTTALGAIMGGIASADLGNGYQDLIVASTGGLEILDGRTGAVVATALHGAMAMQNTPLVTDDPNGTIGITVAGYNAYNQGIVVHLEVPGSPGSRANEYGAWPMFHHDPGLSGKV